MFSVMYVDDERDLCDLGKVFLEQTPEFAVTTFTSASEALSSPDLRRFDAIVSDYQMPGIDGLEFLRRVRAEHADMPFILFTGRGREEVVIEAINYGVDFYLQKGGDPAAQFAELAHKIRIAVERRQAQGALKDSEQRLNDIINFLPDATLAIDRAGMVIAWNRAIEEMTGVPATEMLGKGDHEYAIPFYGTRRKILIDLIFEDDEYIAKTYTHIIHEKGILIADTTLPRPKGRTVTLLGKASPLYNRQGETVGAIESIRDITDLRRAEEDLRAAYEQMAATNEELQGQYEELAASQQRLRESEEKYRELADLLPQIVFEIDLQYNLTFANRQALASFGFSDTDLVSGLNVLQVIEPTQHELVRRNAEKLIKQEPLGSQEYLAIRNDGSRFPILIYSAPLFRAGVLSGFRGVAIDITERKRAEEELQQREAMLSSIFRAAPIGIGLVANRVLSRVNNRICEMTGYREEELIGQSARILYPSNEEYEYVGREKYEQIREFGTGTVETRWQRKGGKIRDILLSSTPLDPADHEKGVTFTALDMTERKRMEGEIRVKHQQITNLMEGLPLGIFRTTASLPGRRVMANPLLAQMFGYDSMEEFMASSLEDSYSDPEIRQTVVNTIARDGVIQNAEVKFVKKNGEQFWGSISAVAVNGSDGAAVFIDGLITDITERKRQETIMRIQLDLGMILQGANGLEDTLSACLTAAIEISGMDAGGIYLVDEVTGILDLMVSQNLGEEFKATISHYPPESPNARMVMAGKPIYLPYNQTGVVHNRVQEEERLHAIAILPVSFKGKVIACMNITSHTLDEIPAPARIALETIAAQIGGAIKRIRSEEALAQQNERLRASEEALRKEREQLEEITATLPGVVYQFYARPDGSMGLYYVSNRAPEVFGMSGDLDTFFDRFTACVDPRDRGAFLESVSVAVKCAIPWHFEGRFNHASGREIWFEGKSRPVPHGDELVFSGTLSDITARKQAESELFESREKYRVIVETANEGIWALDDQFRTVFTNPRMLEIFGYTAAEMRGRPVWDFVLPAETDSMKREILSRRDGKVGRYERAWVRKDGSLVWCLTAGTPLFGPDGKFTGSFGVFTDITRRKQAEEALAEANRKTKLLNSVTRHDILNQLLALRGFTQVAARNTTDPALAGQLDKIQTIGETITSQVEFTRAYQELGLNVPDWLRLGDIITRTAGSIPIRNARSCAEIEVFTDPMFEKVFFNLFENASRHGKHVTEILVSCEQEAETLRIVVEDNGIGVPSPDKEKIFNRGFGKNTGLGLFLSKEILAITGITIRENGEPGKGARFEMAVPKGVFRFIPSNTA